MMQATDGILTRLGRWIKGTVSGSVLLRHGLGDPEWMAPNYINYSKEGYGGNPYVYACIRLIATAAAGITWSAYGPGKDGTRVKVETSPLNRFITRPNPLFGWASFCERFISHLMLDGNAFLDFVGPENGPNAGQPREAWALRPDRIAVKSSGPEWEPTKSYTYTVDGKTQPIPAAQLLHLWLFHPLDDLRGMPPLMAGAHSVDLNNEGRAWNRSLLKNAAVPSGAFVTKGTLGTQALEDLRGQMNERMSGAPNARRPMLLQGDTSWQALGYNPTEMDWLNGIRLTADEIAMVFNVAPELVGGQNRTYANVGQARKALYELVVLPLLDMVRDELNNYLAPLFPGEVTLDYDRDDIEALSEDRTAVYARTAQATWMTVDEQRAATGLDALPGKIGQVVLTNGALMPLESVSVTENTSVNV